ncbi:hypothetical protein KBABDLON_00009 [Lactobacillus gasseri]|nr:hypothetical protein KBABDLON_00009 [Lactobacillus gasseri]
MKVVPSLAVQTSLPGIGLPFASNLMLPFSSRTTYWPVTLSITPEPLKVKVCV